MRGIEGTHELSRNASRRGKGNEVQEAVEAENKKDHARQISGDCGSGFHNRVLLVDWQPLHGVKHIDVNIIDGVYLWKIQVFLWAVLTGKGPLCSRTSSTPKSESARVSRRSLWRERAHSFSASSICDRHPI